MAKKITYQQAHDELNSIVEELQNNMVTIDIISQKLERAKALVEIC
jgi:exonuclease VII small subunit